MFTGFWRIIKFSFVDLGRNLSLAGMTVLVLTLLLISVNALLGVRLMTREGVRAVKEKIDLSLYLKPNITDEQLKQLEEKIKSIPEVKNIHLTTREQALNDFKEHYKTQPEIVDALSELGDNPLGHSLVIKTDDPNQYNKIITAVAAPELAGLIEDKTFADTQEAVKKINSVTIRIQQFALAIVVLFGLIAITIIFTTIRVAIYTERTEILVKKLVGASNWFIRGPYVFEVIILSTISLGLAFTIIWGICRAVDPYFAPILGTATLLTNYLSGNIIAVAGFEYVAILILTIGTSFIAMRRYLKT